MIYTYHQAEEFLNQFILPLEPVTNPDTFLDRFKIFLKMLGNPHTQFQSVIVSGTSGKGSTSFILSSLLTNAGYKTGYTQSPHLEKMTERIQVSRQKVKGKSETIMLSKTRPIEEGSTLGVKHLPQKNEKILHFVQDDSMLKTLQCINDKAFVDLLNEITPVIEAMKTTDYGVPSYYEILLAMAFLYFAKERVDIAVVEVGLEGKYDGTNVLRPVGFVLTNISLDHTNLLGDTVEKIAEEATFKIKDLRLKNTEQKPFVVSGVTQPNIVELTEKRAKESGSKLFLLHRDFDYEITKSSVDGVTFDFSSSISILRCKLSEKLSISSSLNARTIENLHISLIGDYQAENASLALSAVDALSAFGVNVSEKIIRETLSNLFFPGRFEIRKISIKQKPFTIILDGAHNSAKMQAFLSSFKKFFPNKKTIFIVAFSQGHDITDMLEQIAHVTDSVILTQYGVATDMGKKRAVDISRLKINDLGDKKEKKVFFEKTSQEALMKALYLSEEYFSEREEPLLVATGSLYLVGEVRQLLHRLYS